MGAEYSVCSLLGSHLVEKLGKIKREMIVMFFHARSSALLRIVGRRMIARDSQVANQKFASSEPGLSGSMVPIRKAPPLPLLINEVIAAPMARQKRGKGRRAEAKRATGLRGLVNSRASGTRDGTPTFLNDRFLRVCVHVCG